MLRLLKIKNFAIIESLELEFDTGFNAITGETGAGKSIILDAIGLILGNRANTDLIRAGCDEAVVEALFDVEENDRFLEKIKSFDFETSSEALIRRHVQRNGKNKIYLNGTLITNAMLIDLCENLVDLCSQHEHQSLSKSAFQLDLVDRYSGLFASRRDVGDRYHAIKELEKELNSLQGNEEVQARTEDFLKFQLQELEEFEAKEGEEESLQEKRKRLLNATQLIESVSQVMALISGDDQTDHDALSLLKKASQRLAKSISLDSSLEDSAQGLERAIAEIEDAASKLMSYKDRFEFDGEALEKIEDRLETWSAMKKKYGTNYQQICASQSKLKKELDALTGKQARIDELRKLIKEATAAYLSLAKELSKKRKAAAKKLEKTVQEELTDLRMPETRFEIAFSDDVQTAEGSDRTEFLFSPNQGEPLKPISKVASGGELSRILLSIRRTIANRGGIGVYLFDEIDAGIGGQTASVVGRKLKSVAKFSQVICITHLPQVAAFADRHYSVSKRVEKGRTQSEIHELRSAPRIDELARMLGGLDVTEKSRAHARDLLKQAQV